MTAELHTDTGRPDSRELSRVVAVKLLTRSGVLTEESLEFRPTGTVTRTPVDPGQLVPGDPTGLTQAAAALTEWAATAPTGLSSLALEASAAHARLGQRLAEQRAEAEALFSRVQAEGVPADVICNAKNVRSFIAANPAQAEAVGELAARAATMRMAWVDLQNDFIDDLAGVRQELDIADW
ncbi:hypothetical protein [[Pseudopropionibacterium] massiliense]|uniref:hypothetical protein n=1 Tax=[Pseudopropionibacterium] massiliense TaxID=2220000 RepID=UPI001031852B|nr:hypothetical protein [[Pseudopropionibacterium] massiliense]